jgi:predicted nucleotidyltransferase
MSDIYPILTEQLRPLGMTAAMAALQRGFAQFGVDFYIVGAVARDIWMTQVYNEPGRRMTKDLDLAVFIADTEQYVQLRNWLLTHEHFTTATNSAFCLHYAEPNAQGQATEVVVDLMPFGGIADEVGDVRLNGEGMGRISTVGFTEVLADAATMTTPAGEQWRVVTLPGMVVLKLVAWEDRPEVRGKDATDIWGLLEVYFDLVDEVIYTDHSDLFDEDDTSDPTHFKLLVGARVMGRQMQQLVADGPVLTRLLGLLTTQVERGDGSQLALAMSRRAGDSRSAPTLAMCLATLEMLCAGLEDDWPARRLSD